MRWPRRKQPRVLKLPNHGDLRQYVYSFEGERYVLERASWSTDGDMQLTLVTEASFRERYAAREQRRRWTNTLRRWRREDDGDAG